MFGMSGGAAVHLFDSVSRHSALHYVCSQHEQSAAMSADGYARSTGRLGVAITTSGPGATNLLTGVCCSFYDSVPTLMITGQVATHRLKGERPVRQVGFQETDVVSIFGTVTKYAHKVDDPNSIRFHLEKAYHLAFEGRPGTVLIDIPDDLQRADVDPSSMDAYVSEVAPHSARDLRDEIDDLMSLIKQAERPLIILGGGLTTPRIGPEIESLIDHLNIPVLMTWAALDLLSHEHPLRVGSFGVYGPRLGNFAVQNADLIIALGTRLSQNVTGGILSSFARAATIVMVDVSRGEMDKFDGRGITINRRIHVRVKDFVAQMASRVRDYPAKDYVQWKAKIAHWRMTLPDDRPPIPVDSAGFVDAVHFVDELSSVLKEDETIFVDTGGNLTWTCNNLRVKRGQKLLSAWNNTPMGYALPAAIGASVECRPRPVTCIIGDGGLMLCLSELATVAHHKLPIRILLFNNHCHGIQKQTLDTWLGGNYVGVDPTSGLAFCNFSKVAEAMGIPVLPIRCSSSIPKALNDAYAIAGPVLCNVEIHPNQKLYPVLKFGSALENQLPSMDQARIADEMIVPAFAPAAADVLISPYVGI